LKTTKRIESDLNASKRTQEKRNTAKEKLQKIGNSSESVELVLKELEKYCQLIIQSIK
jgi:hypothetical protein|tara:strand:- start:345 stop:518 length:174 start_codon:yes stop_codon:yes gene_type:complete